VGKADAVRTQSDALDGLIARLGENFDERLGRIVHFDYSPDQGPPWACTGWTALTWPGSCSASGRMRCRSEGLGFAPEIRSDALAVR
jgi:hypothetical protein